MSISAAQNVAAAQNSLPSGSGIIAKNEGFVSNATCANSSLSDFFVTIEVSSLGATQVVPYIYQKRSCDGSAKFFPFMTAIIFVEDGEVQTITYDEECAFCNGKSNCQANGFDKSRNDTFSSDVYVECGYSPDECSNLAGGGADCDLRVSSGRSAAMHVCRPPVAECRYTSPGLARTQTGNSSHQETPDSADFGNSLSAACSMPLKKRSLQ